MSAIKTAIAAGLEEKGYPQARIDRCERFQERVAGTFTQDGNLFMFYADSEAGTLEVVRDRDDFFAFKVDRKCEKGYSCGNGCISRLKACLKRLNADQQKAVRKLKGAARKALADALNEENEQAAAAAGGGGEPAPTGGGAAATPEPGSEGAGAETAAESGANTNAAAAAEETEGMTEAERMAAGVEALQASIYNTAPTGDPKTDDAIAQLRAKVDTLTPEQQIAFQEEFPEFPPLFGLDDVTDEGFETFMENRRASVNSAFKNLSIAELKQRAGDIFDLDEETIAQYGNLRRRQTYLDAIAEFGGDPERQVREYIRNENLTATAVIRRTAGQASTYVDDTIAAAGASSKYGVQFQAISKNVDWGEYKNDYFQVDNETDFTAELPMNRSGVHTVSLMGTGFVNDSSIDPAFDGFIDQPDVHAAIASYGLDVNNSVFLQTAADPTFELEGDYNGEPKSSLVEGMRAVALTEVDEGGVVVMPATNGYQQKVAEQLGLEPVGRSRTFDDFGDSSEPNNGLWIGRKVGDTIVPFEDTDGQFEAITEVRDGRYAQMNNGAGVQRLSEYGLVKYNTLEEERAAMRSYSKTEDRIVGRVPDGQHGTLKDWESRSDAWSRETFGEFTEGANGFSLAATKAHDVAHPVTHELTGLDSAGIRERFGGFNQADGTRSLIGEEAIVNVVEHLSRGDSFEASVLNGVRLAKVLSRGSNTTPEEARYYRSNDFQRSLYELSKTAFRHNNFSPLMEIVMESNRTAGTVLVAGDDFSSSASGG